MKILFILDLYKPHVWWVEILFENLIRGLVEQGNVVKVLTSRYDFHLPIYEKLDNGVEIYRVGHNRYDFMLACFKKGIALAHRADIILTTTYNSAFPASIISKIVRKKVVLTVHEIFGKLWYRFMWWKGFFFTLFESFLFKFHFDKYKEYLFLFVIIFEMILMTWIVHGQTESHVLISVEQSIQRSHAKNEDLT